MKFRGDFVTNSSSSSYILVFDREPKTTKDVQQIIFGERKSICYGCYTSDGYNVCEEQLSEKISFYNFFLNQNPMLDIEVINEIVYYGYSLIDNDKSIANCSDDEREGIIKQLLTKKAYEFINNNRFGYYYKVSVGDSEGDFSSGIYSELDYNGSELFNCKNIKFCEH